MSNKEMDTPLRILEQILFLAEGVLSMLEDCRYSDAETGTCLIIEKAHSGLTNEF